MIPYDENKAMRNRMTKERFVKLTSWLIQENCKCTNSVSVDEVIAKFYRSKIFECLMNPETNFYKKSIEELKKLIKREYESNLCDLKR